MRRLLLLPVLALAAPLLTAAPATAATVDSFTLEGLADDLAVYAGTTLEVAWDVTPLDPAAMVTVAPAGTAVDVVDGWDAATVAGAVDSTVDVTIPEDAEADTEYTFQLVVSEDGTAAVSDVLTVLVLETPVSITPPPVVFDGCDVVIPDVEGLSWLVSEYYFDEGYGSTGSIEPGRHPLAAFGDGDDTTFSAVPDEGFDLTPGAPSSFPVPAEYEACLEEDLVEIEPGCRSVVVTNGSDDLAEVVVEPTDGTDPQELELEAGATRTIAVDAERVEVQVGVWTPIGPSISEYSSLAYAEVEVDQVCASAPVARPTHPTAAPAAGA